MRVAIPALFLILGERLPVFPHWEWCLLSCFRRWLLRCWGMFLYPYTLKTGLARSTARRVNAMASSKETKTLYWNLLIWPSGNRRLMYFMSPYQHRGGVLFPLKWALLIISPWNGLFSSPCLYCAWFLWSGEAELRCGPSVVSSIGAAGNGMMHTSQEETISLEAVSCLLPELKPATRHMP